MRHSYAALLLLSLAMAPPLPASAESDAQLWTMLTLTKEATPGLGLSLEQEFRFDNDVTRLQTILATLAADYRLVQWLDVGGGWRLAYQRRRDDSMGFRQRFHLQSQARGDLGALRFRGRLRLQMTVTEWFDPSFDARIRLGTDWRAAAPFVPYVSAEAFVRLAAGDSPALRKMRLTAGIKYGIGDHSLGLFYRLEEPFLDRRDPRLHILGLCAQWDL
jgi:hypothetical protein